MNSRRGDPFASHPIRGFVFVAYNLKLEGEMSELEARCEG
jgi:hypothetical protein